MIKSDIRSNIQLEVHSQPSHFLEEQVPTQSLGSVHRQVWRQVRNIVWPQVNNQVLRQLYAQLRTDIDELI
jgi:hypothetical protein